MVVVWCVLLAGDGWQDGNLQHICQHTACTQRQPFAVAIQYGTGHNFSPGWRCENTGSAAKEVHATPSTRGYNVTYPFEEKFLSKSFVTFRKRVFNRAPEIQIPHCGTAAAPVVCFSRGCATCMMRHCQTKWTAFMGPIHSLSLPPPAARA